ncbi:MAG: phosphatidylglycerol lysyltransferase domain-containing protein, partial [Gracilibacteraceae bacterium]|nr:phosphatidylglycerol lysyltransferase domain-containing protein [Gracilibacteraceae bacterium]
MEFKELRIEDCDLLDEYLARRERTGCQESKTTTFMWASRYQTHFHATEEWFFLRNAWEARHSFSFPMGSKEADLAGAVAALRAECRRQGQQLMLWSVTEEQKSELEAACPGVFEFSSVRDSWDYVYEAERLAQVTGNKLHGKRNHINHFLKEYPAWQFEKLSEENFGEVCRMSDEWCRRYGCSEKESLKAESCAVERCLTHYRALGVVGGVLRVNGEVAAFSLASPLGSRSFDVHVEKAFHDMQGAYQMINREMARFILSLRPDVKWINREDDVGDEGLRKAKLSY